jgi:hypothetical protein
MARFGSSLGPRYFAYLLPDFPTNTLQFVWACCSMVERRIHFSAAVHNPFFSPWGDFTEREEDKMREVKCLTTILAVSFAATMGWPQVTCPGKTGCKMTKQDFADHGLAVVLPDEPAFASGLTALGFSFP